DASGAILTSAKQGVGVDEVLEAIVRDLPPPRGEPSKPLAALIFDSWFDPYHGAVILCRVFEGRVAKGTRIRLMATGSEFEVDRVGVFSPRPVEVEELGAGEVGFVMAGIKVIDETRIGDTVTEASRPTAVPLAGFKPVKPMVFSGLYPADTAQYEVLRD